MGKKRFNRQNSIAVRHGQIKNQFKLKEYGAGSAQALVAHLKKFQLAGSGPAAKLFDPERLQIFSLS